jgi:hypothetical protein
MMNMHDRYYEPADDDSDDIDEFVNDWVQFESREGGDIYPQDGTNFAEALGELGMREEIEQWEDCTEDEKEQIKAYWLEVGERMATDAFYDRNY